ncbi:MAG: hypothetical protein II110_05175, partial [Treponema sp.]|nr:hypothetical protein [Treponema sp.]
SPTVVRQAHQPWFDRLTNRGSTRLTNRGSTKLTNHPTVTLCLFFTAFLPLNKEPMEGRLSSVQNCVAILQSPEKSKDGIFFRQGTCFDLEKN